MASKKTTLILVSLGIVALLAGCGGDDDSNPVNPVDTAPPALPGNLDVQYAAAQNTAIVSWDENVTDADFAGYLVSRGSYDLEPVEPGGPTPGRQPLPGRASSTTAGRQVTYYVYSVDTSDNVSAAATVTLEIPVAPGRPGLIATHGSRQLEPRTSAAGESSPPARLLEGPSSPEEALRALIQATPRPAGEPGPRPPRGSPASRTPAPRGSARRGGSALRATTWSPGGFHRSGSVGPNRARVGVSTAPATCITPVSLQRKRSDRPMRAAPVPTDVAGATTTGALPAATVQGPRKPASGLLVGRAMQHQHRDAVGRHRGGHGGHAVRRPDILPLAGPRVQGPERPRRQQVVDEPGRLAALVGRRHHHGGPIAGGDAHRGQGRQAVVHRMAIEIRRRRAGAG